MAVPILMIVTTNMTMTMTKTSDSDSDSDLEHAYGDAQTTWPVPHTIYCVTYVNHASWPLNAVNNYASPMDCTWTAHGLRCTWTASHMDCISN